MTEPTPQAQPGWYPIAPGSSQLRWWDGAKWTEHTHDTAVTNAYAPAQTLRAPAGTRPYTVWIWILAISPLASLIGLATEHATTTLHLSTQNIQDPLAIYRSTGYLTTLLIGLIVWAVSVLLSALDYRQLAKAGVPQPFHWAWSFLFSGVYIIGRAVIVRRRTGAGLAPLWVWVAAYAVTLITTIAVTASAIAATIPT